MLGNPPEAECDEYFTSQPLPHSKGLALLFFSPSAISAGPLNAERGGCIAIGENLIFI
jgi:hypothetical protein